MQESIGKPKKFNPCKIVTPENFSPILWTSDYVRHSNYHSNFCANRFGGDFSPTRWNI